MTFDRFYSIIKPHRAASFNTTKRAKITVLCIIIFSSVFNVPHLFMTAIEGRQSVPLGKGMDKPLGLLYYWMSFSISYALPLVALLLMNSFIIQTLRKRLIFEIPPTTTNSQDQGHPEGQSSRLKTSDRQIFVILLLVAFSFFVLNTPAYALILYVNWVNYSQTPKSLAGFHLFYNVAHKTYFTNCGINFFLYVISGQKFRNDLVALFVLKSKNVSQLSQISQLSSTKMLKQR